MKRSSMNYFVSEDLPEVEQISLFSNMASGGASQTTELLPIESSMLNTGESPSEGAEYMLSAILVENPPEWSLLSEKALNGMLPEKEYGNVKLPAAHYTPDFVLTYADGTVEVVEVKSKFTRRQQRDYIHRRRMFIDLVAEPQHWRFIEHITPDTAEEIRKWKRLAEQAGKDSSWEKAGQGCQHSTGRASRMQ